MAVFSIGLFPIDNATKAQTDCASDSSSSVSIELPQDAVFQCQDYEIRFKTRAPEEPTQRLEVRFPGSLKTLIYDLSALGRDETVGLAGDGWKASTVFISKAGDKESSRLVRTSYNLFVFFSRTLQIQTLLANAKKKDSGLRVLSPVGNAGIPTKESGEASAPAAAPRPFVGVGDWRDQGADLRLRSDGTYEYFIGFFTSPRDFGTFETLAEDRIVLRSEAGARDRTCTYKAAPKPQLDCGYQTPFCR